MKIHEYQAKAILARHGVPVPRGEVAFSGRRGRTTSPSDSAAAPSSSRHRFTPAAAARAAASRSPRARTKPTRAAARPDWHDASSPTRPARHGQVVQRVLVEAGPADHARAVSRHRARPLDARRPVMMASPDGGVEIEKVAEETPGADLQGVHPPGCRAAAPFQARKLAFALGLAGDQVGAGRQADDGASTTRSWRPTPRSSRSTRWS